MPDSPLLGLHHVTALSGAAQDTVDFYTGVLGLRRVKTTVNFDDPTTPHLYYGDTRGQPGTLATFFAWPRARAGRSGAGMGHSLAFAVPPGTLEDWASALADIDVDARRTERFGEAVLQFEDPSGLPVALVATAHMANDARWTDGPVPAARAVRGLHAPTVPVFSDDRTPDLFTDLFGWTAVDTDEDRHRLRAPTEESEGPDSPGALIDLQVRDRHPSGRMGRGTIHHLAFRTPDADAQKRWQQRLRAHDIEVTEVKDRRYFQSIYFRDPTWTSGILFEIATDGPGFLIDESEDALGTSLQLPPALRSRRDEIASALPPLSSPLS